MDVFKIDQALGPIGPAQPDAHKIPEVTFDAGTDFGGLSFFDEAKTEPYSEEGGEHSPNCVFDAAEAAARLFESSPSDHQDVNPPAYPGTSSGESSPLTSVLAPSSSNSNSEPPVLTSVLPFDGSNGKVDSNGTTIVVTSPSQLIVTSPKPPSLSKPGSLFFFPNNFVPCRLVARMSRVSLREITHHEGDAMRAPGEHVHCLVSPDRW